MSIGIIISRVEAETVWNALRFANFSLKKGKTVRVFLLAQGVEIDAIVDVRFDVKGQLDTFLAGGGVLQACGTCLKSRLKEESTTCPLSTMDDLLKLVEECDKVLTF